MTEYLPIGRSKDAPVVLSGEPGGYWRGAVHSSSINTTQSGQGLNYKAALLELLTSGNYIRIFEDDVILDGSFEGPRLRKAITQLVSEGLITQENSDGD